MGGRRRRSGKRLRPGLRTAGGALLLSLLAVMALLAPGVWPLTGTHTPIDVDLSLANLPPASAGHLLGTDFLGRDILCESMWGARASLAVGILAAGIAVSVGSLWGAMSALAGGAVDAVMMRVVDGLLSIPALVLVLALQSFMSSPQLTAVLPPAVLAGLAVSPWSHGLMPLATIVLVISATTWLEAARLARAQVMTIRSQEYVLAARSLGVGRLGMLLRHLLPNAAVPLVVEATLLVSDAVLMEAGLSYLGLGLGPGIPSWGQMVASAQMSLIDGNWWAALTPGILISALVLAVNLLGEGWLEVTGSRHHRVAAQPGA